jgi:hypothetical protein
MHPAFNNLDCEQKKVSGQEKVSGTISAVQSQIMQGEANDSKTMVLCVLFWRALLRSPYIGSWRFFDGG